MRGRTAVVPPIEAVEEAWKPAANGPRAAVPVQPPEVARWAGGREASSPSSLTAVFSVRSGRALGPRALCTKGRTRR